MVRDLVAEALEDHLDYLDGVEALKESGEIPHEEVLRRLGLE